MPKILGKFTPYDASNKLLDGRYVDGNITGSQVSASGAIVASSFTGDGSGLTGLAASYTQAEISGALGTNADFIRNQTADKVSGSLGTNATFLRNLTPDKVSQSLGSNATFLRSHTSANVSGALGANAPFIRSLTQADVSGSLGTNANFIRNQTAGKVSGSWQGELSSSELTFAGGGISGSVTSTGSFSRVEVSADGFAIGGTEINQTVAQNITALDQQLYTASTPTFAGVTLTGDSTFGNALTDTYKATGSLKITGSLEVDGVFNIDGGTF